MKISDLTVAFIVNQPMESLSIVMQSALRNLSSDLWIWIMLLLLLVLPLLYDALTKSGEINTTFERYKAKGVRVDAWFALFDLSHVRHMFFIVPFSLMIASFLAANFTGLSFVSMDSMPVLVQLITLFVILDISVYFMHRFQHRNIVAWQFHKTHHSQKDLTALTSFRKTLLDRFFEISMLTIPAFVLSIDHTYPFYIYVMIIAHQLLIHSTLPITFGRLGYIIVPPDFHKLHHSADPQHHYGNYGGALAVWDHLFGTYLGPTHGPLTFGVHSEEIPESFIKQLFVPLIGIYGLVKQRFFQSSIG
ncbi:sterol desaturase family protein [Pseudomonadales bacterium]|nr:sterol desaturase family protein [Pseudomonadales bacterium]